MERNVHYILVGFFISLSALCFAAFIVWFTGSYDLKTHKRYTVYFTGSVNGISEGSKVRYLGVEVGQVANIRLAQSRADRIKVDIRVLKKTPVSQSTTATLKPQGITGLSFVALKTDPSDQGSPERIKGERYPVIYGSESRLDKVFKKLPKIADRLSAATMRIEKTLSEQNVAQVTKILENLEKLSATLNAKSGPVFASMDHTFEDIRKTSSASRELIATSKNTVEHFNRSLSSLDPAIRHITAFTRRLDDLTRRNEKQIDHFLGTGLMQASLLLQDSRGAVKEINTLADELAEKPSKLIFDTHYKGLKIPK